MNRQAPPPKRPRQNIRRNWRTKSSLANNQSKYFQSRPPHRPLENQPSGRSLRYEATRIRNPRLPARNFPTISKVSLTRQRHVPPTSAQPTPQTTIYHPRDASFIAKQPTQMRLSLQRQAPPPAARMPSMSRAYTQQFETPPFSQHMPQLQQRHELQPVQNPSRPQTLSRQPTPATSQLRVIIANTSRNNIEITQQCSRVFKVRRADPYIIEDCTKSMKISNGWLLNIQTGGHSCEEGN